MTSKARSITNSRETCTNQQGLQGEYTIVIYCPTWFLFVHCPPFATAKFHALNDLLEWTLHSAIGGKICSDMYYCCTYMESFVSYYYHVCSMRLFTERPMMLWVASHCWFPLNSSPEYDVVSTTFGD